MNNQIKNQEGSCSIIESWQNEIVWGYWWWWWLARTGEATKVALEVVLSYHEQTEPGPGW